MSCVQLFWRGYSYGIKKPRADGRHVGGEWIAEIPGGTKGESLVIERTANVHGHGWLCAFLATLPCTSIWGMNMLEGYWLVGGVWWDKNTLRWLIRAWGELLFISRYSLLCYESSDTLKTGNRLQWSMQYSWLGISKVEELEKQAKCVPALLQLAHLGFGSMGWGGRRLVHFQVMTQLWVWK